MKNAMQGILALLEVGMRKQSPAASRHQAIFGNVVRSRLRRPKVSMVYTAGKAKTKRTSPNPIEASRLLRVE
jgi:hypothetical protein